jgi:hypothetical protein
MTDTPKKYKNEYLKLIRLLKDRAEDRTCFDIHGDSYDKTSGSHNDAFHDGSAWGGITFAREVLGEMGVKFEEGHLRNWHKGTHKTLQMPYNTLIHTKT